MFMRRTGQLAAAAVAVVAIPLSAGAVPADYSFNACPAAFTTDGTANVYHGGASQLTAASQCTYLLPADNANDQVGGVTSDTHVNVNDVTGIAASIDGFFGVTSWQETTLNHLDQNASSGTWAIAAGDLDFTTFNYMLVFKDGADTNLVAFLLNEEASSGSWLTPFLEPPFSFPGGSTSHETSHISLYRTIGPNFIPPAPEPGTLTILGFGLAGLGWLGARRRRQTR